jgi:hypothetical protein
MRGPNFHRHHDQAFLGGPPARGASLGGRWRALLLLVSAGLVAQAHTSLAGGESASRIPLPTEASAQALVPLEQTALFGKSGIENRRPGPVADVEAIDVGLGPTGTPVSVRVTQRLTVSGLGDFSFRVPGPAQDVQALPDSQVQPGLRKGSVLWQGFSPGTKVLAATMDLFPGLEAARLPIRFRISATVDGKPLQPGRSASGRLVLSIRVSNVSAIPVQVSVADGDRAELAATLDAIHAALAHSRRPRPGLDDVPVDLAARGPVAVQGEEIEAPIRIEGELLFPTGTLVGPVVQGGSVSLDRAGTHIGFEQLLGGGEPLELALSVTGELANAPFPQLRATARTALPSPQSVTAPTGGRWTTALAKQPEALDPQRMVALVMETMWRVARLRQFDAYLGDPDPTGPARSTFLFGLAPPGREAIAGPATPAPNPLVIAGASLAAVALLFGLALAWAHS